MATRVALQHVTRCKYDRFVTLSPHEIRLRPAPHSRTPIQSYSLTVVPMNHFVNWQQDAFGNYVARFVFPKELREMVVTMAMVVDLAPLSPFEPPVEPRAAKFPFEYPADLAKELAIYLQVETPGPLLSEWLKDLRQSVAQPGGETAKLLADLNRRIMNDIRLQKRELPVAASCEEILRTREGAAPDLALLMVQTCRHLGLAARFVSGYHVQLASEAGSLDDASGSGKDSMEMQCWVEVHVPGPGWIGMDPISGSFAGAGHIALAATAVPGGPAPITGLSSGSGMESETELTLIRMQEGPRVVKPYQDAQWDVIRRLAKKVDVELKESGMELRHAVQPTFLLPEGGSEEVLGKLVLKLHRRLAIGGMVHWGAARKGHRLVGLYWRKDGRPMWRDLKGLADPEKEGEFSLEDARKFLEALAGELGVSSEFLIAAHEDAVGSLVVGGSLRREVEALRVKGRESEEWRRFSGIMERGVGEVLGWVLPLEAGERAVSKDSGEAVRVFDVEWRSGCLASGDKGCCLVSGQGLSLGGEPVPSKRVERCSLRESRPLDDSAFHEKRAGGDGKREEVGGGVSVEVREGRLHVWMPALGLLEDYLALLAAVESVSNKLKRPVVLEGAPPPEDCRVHGLKVVEEGGLIRVELPGAETWNELVRFTESAFGEASQLGLEAERFSVDGRHLGTGGGSRVLLGGRMPGESPFLKRADLFRSLVTYWQHHPSLSYLFCGGMVGACGVAPRLDEFGSEGLYEAEIALQGIERAAADGGLRIGGLVGAIHSRCKGLVSGLEFGMERLFSGEWEKAEGILEYRGFEMASHAQLSLMQMLFLRALLVRFWKQPYRKRFVHWGTRLHDQCMLPQFILQDLEDVLLDLKEAGFGFEEGWLRPFFELRFPRYGSVVFQGVELEVRQAVELEVGAGHVMERLQVRVKGLTPGRHMVFCNGRSLPLHATGVLGEMVAGVRFRGGGIGAGKDGAPLSFCIVDQWTGRALGRCVYHSVSPDGKKHEVRPANPKEAEARRLARFQEQAPSSEPAPSGSEVPNPHYPMTLDLRWMEA